MAEEPLYLLSPRQSRRCSTFVPQDRLSDSDSCTRTRQLQLLWLTKRWVARYGTPWRDSAQLDHWQGISSTHHLISALFSMCSIHAASFELSHCSPSYLIPMVCSSIPMLQWRSSKIHSVLSLVVWDDFTKETFVCHILRAKCIRGCNVSQSNTILKPIATTTT